MVAKVFPDLPGWVFSGEEVSMGHYKVSARDEAGRSVELSGSEYEPLFEEVRQWAIKHKDDRPTRTP